LAYNPNDPFEIYHFSGEVWKSDEFGENWYELGSPPIFGGAPMDQAAIAENNSNIIVVSKGANIQKSFDGGQNFVDIKSNLPNFTIRDIAFDPKNDSVLVVVYDSYQNNGQKVYITEDGGLTWTNQTNNLGDMPLRSVVIDHSNASNIYVGAEIGVYVMPKNGTAWTLYNSELPNVSVRELEINYGSNTIRAATWGRGMWEYCLKDRLDYPAIMTTSITNPPTFDAPLEGVDQYVTSKISYVGSLTKVYVEWSINNPVFGNVINMTNTQDSTWVTNSPFPQFPTGTKLYFKVFAVGSAGDTTETYKFMYRVRFNVNLGVSELEKDKVILFPNPNSGEFTVDLGTKEVNVKLSILSLDGKKVWESNYRNTAAIDCKTELKKGNYFLIVESEGTNVVKKLVVE
jgi:hypothetical protein